MPPTDITRYQDRLAEILRRIYPDIPIQKEWAAMSGEENLYSPRIDLAVGPFAVSNYMFESKYDHLMENSREFIERLIGYTLQNIQAYGATDSVITFENLKSKNRNARCLLAIEIENNVSRKHLMGGAINAAALGRIGIAVAWSTDKLKAFIKLRKYLHFLGSVGKNTFDTTNLLIMDKEQLFQAIHSSGGLGL